MSSTLVSSSDKSHLDGKCRLFFFNGLLLCVDSLSGFCKSRNLCLICVAIMSTSRWKMSPFFFFYGLFVCVDSRSGFHKSRNLLFDLSTLKGIFVFFLFVRVVDPISSTN